MSIFIMGSQIKMHRQSLDFIFKERRSDISGFFLFQINWVTNLEMLSKFFGHPTTFLNGCEFWCNQESEWFLLIQMSMSICVSWPFQQINWKFQVNAWNEWFFNDFFESFFFFETTITF